MVTATELAELIGRDLADGLARGHIRITEHGEIALKHAWSRRLLVAARAGDAV